MRTIGGIIKSEAKIPKMLGTTTQYDDMGRCWAM